MSYVNKSHKINFALDDKDYNILIVLSEKFHCSNAEVFRLLLRDEDLDIILVLNQIRKDLDSIKQDLFKLLRS